MKRGGEGAAVKIVNNYVVPDDFGHRKRALVQILPPQPTLRTEKDIGSKKPRNHSGFGVLLCHFLR